MPRPQARNGTKFNKGMQLYAVPMSADRDKCRALRAC
jgi:hypothetical protein